MGEVVFGLAGIAVLVWLAILLNNSRTRVRREAEAPLNLQPYLTDDDLETKRVDRVLIAALISAAVLAIVVPLYYLTEADRQADAAEGFAERDIEEGEHWYSTFQCIDCHGAAGVGGGVAFVEPRSDLETLWSAPALNDIYYRYSEDEVRYWIVFGRAGSPMPAWGLEGGGAMTSQEVDQLLAYLKSIEIPQAEAFAATENQVNLALSALDNADETVAGLIEDQREVVGTIEAAPALYEQARTIPDEFEGLLTEAGTCTDETAALFERPCEREGVDADQDGVSDAAEVMLTTLLRRSADLLSNEELGLALDPQNAFSTDRRGEPVADLRAVDRVQTDLNTAMLNLRVTAEAVDQFRARAEGGLAFLEDAAAARRYAIDFQDLADQAFAGNVEEARRAAGLYNAYCARCHTAGYSAGVAYTQEAGSGAFGPSLRDGRSIVQFPDPEDHLDFIINGSENAKAYGINGIGRGWMPGFGFILSEADLRLIIEFERWL